MSFVAGSVTYGSYLDLNADVKPWLQVPANNISQDFALQRIIDMACEFIQGWLARPIAPQPYDFAFDGAAGFNSGYIMLPKWPVLSVESVVEFQGSNPVELAEVTQASGADGYQLTPATGRLTRVLGGIWNRPFYPGSRNVVVNWTAGYNPVPPSIWMATVELVAHWFRNTQQAAGPGARTGDYDPMAAAGLWAGMPNRITGLLTPYRTYVVA